MQGCLDEDTQRIEDMFLLGEDLVEKLSNTGSLDVSCKMEDIKTLKASLELNLNTEMEQLKESLERWQKFSKDLEVMEKLLLSFSCQLKEVSSADIQLETPDKLQVI